MKFNRRNILYTAGGCAATASGLVSYSWLIEPHWIDFVHRTMFVSQLPDHWAGKRIVHISDLHVGNVVDDDYLIKSFQTFKQIEADIVVMTGDFVSYESSYQYDQLSRILEHFPHGKETTLGVLGNHDYGHGWSKYEVGDEITDRAENAGINILRNERTDIKGLKITGLDDYWGPNYDPQPVLKKISKNDAEIVLCHNPDVVDENVWFEFQGWVLSGHTHGGQCKPPFLPPPLLPVKNKKYTSGMFDLNGGKTLYINRGLGYLMRVRFNARPEVTVFTLTNQLV